MPVISSRARSSHVELARESLIDQILKELLDEGTYDGPVIFEVGTPEPNLIYATVVWEAWKGIPAGERSSIIVEAYDRLAELLRRSTAQVAPTGRPLEFPRASTAVGATYSEVIERRLLPYGLRPAHFEGTRRSLQVQEAMRPLGVLPAAPAMELLLPTREMRDESLARLTSLFPDIRFETFELPETA